jgi:DNA polymerase-1
LFSAPHGWNLIGVDAKALELRCLAGYLALWDHGEYAALVTDDTVDIHEYNRQQFGVATRDISKRLLYGMLYGCGAIKAGTIIDPNEKNETVLKKLGSNAINSFMHGVPALRELKEKLSSNLAERGVLLGLDKRILYCRSDFKALNVLLQSAGAILMKQVVVNLHNNMQSTGLIYGTDWVQHAMVHDEIQLSCKPQHTELLKEKALLSFPQAQNFFAFKCDIEGDAKVGHTWYDTH